MCVYPHVCHTYNNSIGWINFARTLHTRYDTAAHVTPRAQNTLRVREKYTLDSIL